jgi:hypothetical protein
VAIDDTGRLDLAATAQRREATSLYQEVRLVRIIETAEFGPDRLVGLSPKLVEQLQCQAGHLVEVTNGSIPLRGWVDLDEKLTTNEITLPSLFAISLDIQTGATVKLRCLSSRSSVRQDD